jgi:hypothetical protein
MLVSGAILVAVVGAVIILVTLCEVEARTEHAAPARNGMALAQ